MAYCVSMFYDMLVSVRPERQAPAQVDEFKKYAGLAYMPSSEHAAALEAVILRHLGAAKG